MRPNQLYARCLFVSPGCAAAIYLATEWLARSNNVLVICVAVLMGVSACVMAAICVVALGHFLILSYFVAGALLARNEWTRLRYYASAAAWGHEISEHVEFKGVLVRAKAYIEVVPEGTVGMVVRRPGGPFTFQFPGREPYRFTLEYITWYVEIL